MKPIRYVNIIEQRNTTKRNILIIFPSSLSGIINSEDVVISFEKYAIKLREATILDLVVKKLSKVNNSKIISMTFEGCKNYIGKYNIEKEEDYFYLTKIE
jgi:hypothetical protein